jgi:hypothetical protein
MYSDDRPYTSSTWQLHSSLVSTCQVSRWQLWCESFCVPLPVAFPPWQAAGFHGEVLHLAGDRLGVTDAAAA